MINLFWFILLPILAGCLMMVLPPKFGKKIILLFQVAFLGFSILNFLTIHKFGLRLENIGSWPNTIGITLRADLFASGMIFITALLFLAMLIYSQEKSYIDQLFLFLFISLQGLIIGIFLSNDLFNIFVMIEASTLIITILIMYKKENLSIYDGIMYFFINVVAMSFFLFGIGILYKKLGAIDFFAIQEVISQMDNPGSIILPYAFLITAVSLKAALMPLFSWLPKAHGTLSAPSVVSAILSGLYVKTGIYLFIRLQVAFSPLINTTTLFLILGFLTAIIGFILALAQKDIKLILAYHTISQIGLIMVGLNLNNDYAYWGSIFHIFSHAIFKSTLFLTAGMIINAYKTRNVYEIKGVFKTMPIVAWATLFSIFGIIGFPFFNGSISKYFIGYGAKGTWIEYGLLLINLGTILSFIKYSQILFGPSKKRRIIHSSLYENSVVLFLGVSSLFTGIFGIPIMNYCFNLHWEISPMSYGIKIFQFCITFLLGLLIYYGFLKKKNIFTRFTAIDLTFNESCLAITLFFFFILTYLKLTL